MIAVAGKFAPPNEAEVTRLIREYPLAWVVTAHDSEFAATLLPLRPFHDKQGRLTELHGHFARSNAQVELVRRHPRALLLFLGPHGYISSSWMSDRTQTPTWNYASAQFVVDIEFIEDGPPMEALIRDLVGAMEADREREWSIDEMGPRYERLVRGIIGFHAYIRETRAKFKLGQDERDDTYAEIMKALADNGANPLCDWMSRCNPQR